MQNNEKTREDMRKKSGSGVSNSQIKNKSLLDPVEVAEVQLLQRDNEDVHELPALIYLKIQRYDGETSEKQFHGEGAASFEGGHVYKGMFSAGLMDGHGIFTLANGLKYEGGFMCNMPAGQGTYTWPDGSTYTGEVYRGKQHGMGTYKCSKQGASYSGEWHQGRIHGKGTVYYNEEKTSWYKGDWVMNNREGSGERCYPSGNIYSGEWKNNMRHGEGTMSWVKAGQLYSGKWERGVQHGPGKHIWNLKRVTGSQYSQSNQYEGDFFQGQRHGRGTFYYAAGAIYKGEWRNNKKHGQGKFTSKDGQVFEGEFVDDQMMLPGLTGFRLLTPHDSYLQGPCMILNIDCLWEKMPERNHEMERKQVECVLLREDVQLRLIYSFYSRLGCSHTPDNTFQLTCLQFWRLLKDCNVHRHGITLTQMDRFITEKVNLAEIRSPFTPMLLREFHSSLIIVAYYIYHKDMLSEKHLLAACFSKLMTDNVLPNARNVKGFLFRQPEFALEAVKYTERCWEIFQAFCRVNMSHGDNTSMTYRQLMWMFQDLRLFDHQLTSTRLLEVFTAESCDLNNQSSCLELEITFLEFFEVLVGCGEVKCLQVSDVLEEEDQVQDQDSENLPEVDGKQTQTPESHLKLRETVNAQDVEVHQKLKNQEEIQVTEQKDVQRSRTEAKTHQLQHRIQTLQQFFDHCLFIAVDHHLLVSRKMKETSPQKK